MKYRFLSLILVLSFMATGCNQPRYQGRTLSSWTHDLKSDTDFKRRQACEAIGEMGKEGEAAIDDVIVLLDDVNEGVQEFCSEALSKIGPASIPALEKILESDEPRMRLLAASALVRIDAKHAKAGKELVSSVTGVGNINLAKDAQGVLIKLGPVGADLLLPYINDKYKPVRIQVIKTFARMEKKAIATLEPLMKIVKEDKDLSMRIEALKATAVIGEREVLEPFYRSFLDSEYEDLAANAGVLLQFIGARESASGNETEEDIKKEADAKRDSAK